MGQQFVLQPNIIAHPKHLSCHEVIEQEVGLARFQYGALRCASPVEEHLRGVQNGHLQRKAPQRVHLGIRTLLLVTEDVFNTDAKLLSSLPRLLGHILQPSDDGHAVICSVAIIHKTLAHILCGVVGQCCRHDRTTRRGLLLADGDDSLAFLHLPDLDDCAVVDSQRIGVLLFRLAHDVPHLILVDDMIRCDANHPVARRFVAPVGVGDILW